MKRALSDFKHGHIILVLFLIAVGIFIRLIEFTNIPSGFNQDEAFAAYEAYSLLNFGVDSFGYVNPVYFISWGSGMNVLASYLAIPFFWLFGCSELTYRLPQLILSICSLIVFYLTLKELFNKKIALLGLFLLAICPWHIMMARWGLESNLAPHFLLFGFYFFIKGLKNNKFWLLSAAMYGASLYSYAIMWAIVPLTVALYVIYILVSRQKFTWLYALLSATILLVMALPLILFMLVNKDIIPEITTSFISIPKIPFLRDGEFTLKNLLSSEAYKSFADIAIFHTDHLEWNSTDFGLFYKISIPFQFIGLTKLIVMTINKIRAKEFSPEVFILLSLLCSCFVSLCITSVNVNKANSLHYFNLILIVLGVSVFLFDIKIKYFIPVKAILIAAYAVCFIMFSSYYLNDYADSVFGGGLAEAVEYAKESNCETIYVYKHTIPYPRILFYDQTSREVYEKADRYQDSTHLDVFSFSNYVFVSSMPKLGTNDIFIVDIDNAAYIDGNIYTITVFDKYAVVSR